MPAPDHNQTDQVLHLLRIAIHNDPSSSRMGSHLLLALCTIGEISVFRELGGEFWCCPYVKSFSFSLTTTPPNPKTFNPLEMLNVLT